MACPILLNLACDAVGGATSTVAGGVLSAIAGWVVGGATWLLDELGQVITSSTSVNVRASWFLPHYRIMLAIAAFVAVPMLVLAAVQSVFQQNAGALVRAAFIHLPLAGLLTVAAVQIVQLALEGTNALCTEVTTGTGGDLDKTFHSIGAVLSHEPLPLPTFVVTVGALLIVMGAFVLWLELLVRSAAIYAAVFFLPLALASLVWPAASHWCKRLTETLVALVLSKFVIVAVLSLAVGAVTSHGSFSAVLAGGALLLLAAFTPFTLLRLIPLVEVGAVMQLEGARQRVRASWGRAPDSAVGFALRQAREHGAHRETGVSPGTPGMPGTGTTLDPGAPGPSGGAGSSGIPRLPGPSGPTGAGRTGSASGVEHSGGVGEAAALMGAAAGGAGISVAGAAVTTGAADAVAGAGSGLAGDSGGGLDLGSIAQAWPSPTGALPPPPGTIPIWPGSPESVVAALEATKQPHRVEPDGYGGVIPGVASPLWGGTEPLSRFEPGPKDDWSAWDAQAGSADQAGSDVDAPPSVPGSHARGAPPFIDRSREEPGPEGSTGASTPADPPTPAHGIARGIARATTDSIADGIAYGAGERIVPGAGGATDATETMRDPDADRDGD